MFNALMANIVKFWLEFKRYYFNTISGVATLLIFFYFMFFGIKAIGGANISSGDTLEGMIVGYFMWTMFIFSFQGVAWGIIEEAQRGTLEQVFMSPIAFEYQMLFRMVSDFIFNVWLAVPLMYFVAFTTKRQLSFDLPTLLYLLIVGTISALGVGMVLGGIALVFKRISSFIQIVTFGSLAFTMFDSSQLWYRLLPMSQAAQMMKKMATTGTRFYQFPFSDHLLLWLAATLYLFVGILIFRIFERHAMISGTLSQY